ncbi:unnamed protein product [Brachionus calyciflorus]|uniref:Uncharacterized protein n=1 Tax=Brachionus calyciflorus TaxID=104777 RepID=A0A814EDD7_9BILA|nr:unnamed protein product [Brachionus calyciflorus]CAF0970666.1 unnamed protein product [Brachionus calyciflorus]
MSENIPILFEISKDEQSLTSYAIDFPSPCSASILLEYIENEIKSNFPTLQIEKILYEHDIFKRKVQLKKENTFFKPTILEVFLKKNELLFRNDTSFKFDYRQNRMPVITEAQSSMDSSVLDNSGFYMKSSNEVVSWRRMLVRTLGTYLIRAYDDKPSKKVKEDHVRELINMFPFLKSEAHRKGYEHIYNIDNETGFLAYYIRNKRSRDPCIDTRHYKKRKVNDLINESEQNELEASQIINQEYEEEVED